jgi:hypothetical protein
MQGKGSNGWMYFLESIRIHQFPAATGPRPVGGWHLLPFVAKRKLSIKAKVNGPKPPARDRTGLRRYTVR